LGLHSILEFNFAFARARGLMVQVMELGLLILIEGICGLPSRDQEVEGTFIHVHEHDVGVSDGA